MKKLKGFVICTVRGASDEYKKKLEDFVAKKESEGWKMHLPHRDTNQEASGLKICTQNFNAMVNADTIFIFYNPESQGTHFDMGMAFALKRQYHDTGNPIKIEIIENIEFGEGKSYARMLDEWKKEQ